MKQLGEYQTTLMQLFTLVLVFITGVSAWAVSPPSTSTSFPLLIDATIESLTKGLVNKKFTSVDLVKAYLARIKEVNGTLHAVTEVNPDALVIAAELDRERSNGTTRGPLHGIPILLKNNIATFDQMNNTAGSWALLGSKVPRDSTVARKLRAAGAILLGKSNLSQWANFRSLNTSNGWSAYGGQTYGAYYPGQDPSGSSSGSGVASSLGLALASLGSETDGSIISPSSSNNVVGIKPSVGLTSRFLVIPISEHQDTVGPIARTVKDAAHILQVIAGVDSNDNYTSAIPNGTIPNYLKACNRSALSGARIGVPRSVISLLSDNSTHPETDAFEQALGVLRAAGAVILDNTTFPAAAEFLNSSAELDVLAADFIVNLHNYLADLTYNPTSISTLADLRNFTQIFPLEQYPQRDTGVWDLALGLYNNTDPRFWPVYQQNLYFGNEGGLLGALKRDNLDAVVMPSSFAPSWAAGVGAPIVTVPLGAYPNGTTVVKDTWGMVETSPNFPFGLSFLGARFSEAKLIGFAYAFEQRTLVRNKIKPYIMPKTELADLVRK